MNLDNIDQAFLFYNLEDNTWIAYETLPVNYSLTAGEDGNTHAFVDISHWTEADLAHFDSLGEEERLSIIESLEFTEFSKQMREHESNIGLAFGMGGNR